MSIANKARLEILEGQQQQAEATSETTASAWWGIYKAGGAAALIAGVLFRRNLGAEISLFIPRMQLDTVSGWFALLRDNRLLGLAYLNFFDIVDYALLGLMFLGLYAALRRASQSIIVIATALGLVGIAVYFASNTAFSMLSLSDQYASTSSEAQRAMLLAAGQAVLAINSPGAVFQGTGIYMSFLLLAVAGLLISIAMLQSELFGRVTAYIGILACVLDLVYCITFALAPALTAYLLSAAGLLLMIWHISIGLKLLQLERFERKINKV